MLVMHQHHHHSIVMSFCSFLCMCVRERRRCVCEIEIVCLWLEGLDGREGRGCMFSFLEWWSTKNQAVFRTQQRAYYTLLFPNPKKKETNREGAKFVVENNKYNRRRWQWQCSNEVSLALLAPNTYSYMPNKSGRYEWWVVRISRRPSFHSEVFWVLYEPRVLSSGTTWRNTTEQFSSTPMTDTHFVHFLQQR